MSSGVVGNWLAGAIGLKEGEMPFPWQERLLADFRAGIEWSALDIPTGLGKTSVMAIWLVARAAGAKLPRRLVYVVDRRAVVDQATEVAEELRAWVKDNRSIADALGLGERPLPISTLRGRHVDNREWLEDPSSPAIVVGTIDMVGSRLLFSGYGVSSKMRPYHAGMLGLDTLIVLDEAHLVSAFEDLVRHIERGVDLFGPKDHADRARLPQFKLLSLSATGRQTDVTRLTISDEDRKNEVVKNRLNARKTLTTVELAVSHEETDSKNHKKDPGKDAGDDDKKGKGSKLVDILAKQAWDLTRQESAPIRCLVFCDARKDAIAVAAELRNLAKSANPQPAVELFVGGRRVRERVQAREELQRHGFLAGKPESLKSSVFLIATSAGEVGVDLDADHMVCDLVAWERMVQRLGRVNRRGDENGKVRAAKVIVVVDPEPTLPTKKAKEALEEKLAKRDAAKSAKEQLDELTKKVSALQDQKQAAPKGKKTGEEKAATEKRKQAEKELKKSISACQKLIKAFKDADAKAVARHEAEVAKHKALRKLLNAIGEGGSLSPEALLQLRERQELADALRDATTVPPLRPELTRALVEAWSMTSLDEHPGRPEVEPWLRGFSPDEPQTSVIWRRHLPVRNDDRFDAKAAKRFFEAAPPHASEQLETETYRVREWLVARATAPEPKASKSEQALLEKRSAGAVNLSEQNLKALSEYDAEIAAYRGRPSARSIVAIALTPRGDVKARWTLSELQAVQGDDNKKLEQLLAGTTLVVDARLGGLTDGFLVDGANTIAEASDDTSVNWPARPDAADVPVTGFRIRQLGTGDQDNVASWRTAAGSRWVPRYLFVTEVVDGEPAAALAIDGWAGEAATEDDRAEADRPQRLDDHQRWARKCARGIAKRLGLDRKYADLLALSARLHDEGKRAVRWQRAFKAPGAGRPCTETKEPYAKTKGPIDFDILDGYRHELGSLPYVEAHYEFRKLSTDDQELVLHLIAAHHGYARPVIGTSGWDDYPPSIADERAREIALRFARLSRRWGPWGLAWWEALLRAADQAASRCNQQGGTSATRKV